MSISQSRANSRGPLIAVIKIQIQDDQVDRIFLHQNDDDYRLAQQFQQKHRLSSAFVQHIFNKIKMSRESLQKESLTNKTPQPKFGQRSGYLFNNSNISNTPLQQARQNTYRNYNDTFPSPFERITRYSPSKQQAPDSSNSGNILRESENTQNQQTNEQTYPNSLQYNYIDLENEGHRNKDNQSSTFETLMQNGKIKINNNQQLFQKYLRERKQNGVEMQTRKLIIKNDNQAQENSSNFESIRARANPNQRINSIQRKKTVVNSTNRSNKKIYSDSHYSFNEDKPQRVKILKKDQIESMQSLQSSKKSLSKFDKQKIAKEVTNRLYNESDIKKSYLNKIKQRAKQQKQQKQDKQLTHRPQINKVSELIAADRYKNVPIQDYLIDKAKRAEVKRQAQRAVKAQRQLENCSFKPKVNVISQKLVRNHSRSQLKDSQNKTLEECSRKHCHSQLAFRPALNKMSEQIVKEKGQGCFEERLKGFLQQKNNKLNQLTKQKMGRQKVDQTGQQLFRPRIYSKPHNRSPKGSHIHDYLYELSKLEKQHKVQEQKPIINGNSEQIIQQMYTKRISWLFSELDSDQDGFISPKKICIDSIGENVLEVIIPVLFEMEQMDIELNLMDFRNAIKNLHPSLNAHQKSILYSYNAKNPHSIKP